MSADDGDSLHPRGWRAEQCPLKTKQAWILYLRAGLKVDAGQINHTESQSISSWKDP